MHQSNLKEVPKVNETVNPSGLHPQGRAILVEAYKDGRFLNTRFIIPDDVKQTMAALENRVRVVEVGPWAWNDEPRPRAKVGDIALITRMAGFIMKGHDGKLYRLVNDRDLFCTCEELEGEKNA